ncbi:PepSY domain-containing protein [Gallibacterium sp. AGMB14963]|uniref:PepSY domain-containing protein n=1 Tax=Gallibacterium faecale TaxID=3019086 RepID=UPI0022F1BBBA|nr:PepSY domain-containing protein [Gallibacterium sp. AGMB14963]MDA3979653.1 PepSY domain-containing protein [Gallibacterium sp. AGMB14963]
MSKLSKNVAIFSTIALITIGTAKFAMADDVDFQRLETALNSSKITLVEAIDIASKKVDGKVLEAKFQPRKRGNPSYDVEILTKEKQIREVRIDAVTSEVIRNEVEEMYAPHRHRKHNH